MELKQRLEMEFDAVVNYFPTRLGLPDEKAVYLLTSMTEKRRQMRRMLSRPLDLLVVGNMLWEALPDEFRHGILVKVYREGMGLVLVFEQDRPYAYEWQRLLELQTTENRGFITRGVPLSLVRTGCGYGTTPGEHAKTETGERDPAKLIKTMRLGKGRVAHIRYPYPEPQKDRNRDGFYGQYNGAALTPFVVYDGRNLHHYEYAMMLLARACLWAARAEGNVEPPPTHLGAIPAGKPTTLSVPLPGSIGTSQLEYLLRDNSLGREVFRGTAELSGPPVQAAAVPLPELPSGTYLLEYRARSDGKVVSFGAPVVEVTSPLSVHLKLGRDDLRGGPLKVSATLSETGMAQGYRVRVVDNYSRLIFEETGKVESKTPSLDIRLPKPLTHLHQITFEALGRDGSPMAAASEEFAVHGVDRPDYFLGPFGCANGYYMSLLMHRRGRDAFGFNIQYDIGGSRMFMWGNLSSAYRLNQWALGTAWYLHRARPWDRGWTIPFERGARSSVKSTLDLGVVPLALACGDEPCLAFGYKEVGTSETATVSFREWLKGNIGDLKTVNQRWGTAFTEWEQVKPLTVEQAAAEKQYARWYDGWAHVTDRFMDLFERTRKEAKKQHPDIRLGTENPLNSGAGVGYDWPRLLKASDFVAAYPRHEHWPLMRSFCRPEALKFACCHGRDADPEGRNGEWLIWSSVMQQFQGLMFHRLDGGNTYGSMGYDLSLRRKTVKPVRTLEEYLEQPKYLVEAASYGKYAAEVNRGPACLVQNAERVGDEVAILYSHPTAYANYLVAHDDTELGYQAYTDSARPIFAMQHLLDDLHVGYEMVSEDQVGSADGPWWIKTGTKLLVLPHTLAMSESVAAGVRAFVESGGVVLAGVRPAIFDELCRPLLRGRLDEVFGASRNSIEIKKLAKGAAELPGLGNFPVIEYDPDLRLLDGAKALGKAAGTDTPAMIENQFGQGRAFLWNIRPRCNPQGVPLPDIVDAWGRLSAAEATLGYPALRAALGNALAATEIRPPLQFAGAAGEVQAIEVAQFVRGDTRLIGLVRRNYNLQPDIEELELSLDEPAHVYDARRGKYLVHGTKFRAPLRCAGAALIALLPYRVEGIELRASVSEAGIEVEAIVKGATEAPYHVLRIEVAGPDGKPRPHYTRNITHTSRETSFTVPLALSDPAGEWTITVRDVLSGEVGRVAVEVRKRP